MNAPNCGLALEELGYVAGGHRHHVERDAEVGGQPYEQPTTRLSAGRPLCWLGVVAG